MTLIAFIGCNGGNRANVSGRVVRSDGTPVTGARVLFRSPETGKSASGITDSDGKYTLGVEKKGDGIPPGTYGVAVSEDRGSWDNPKPRTIHGKYESPKTSELIATIEGGGSSTYDLELDFP